MSRSPEQIFEVETRAGRRRFLHYEVKTLAHYASKLKEDVTPFLEYIPVRLVTIIENCVRGAVQGLVDSGEPYTERGIEIISKWSSKHLVQSLKYFSNKKLTIGQLSAHGFSVGNLADIMTVLGHLSGEDDISSALAEQTTRWTEDKGKDLSPIIVDRKATFSCIDRLFELRHIIVHEMVFKTGLTRELAEEFLHHTGHFVEAIEWFTTERL